MIEPPAISSDVLTACLLQDYGLRARDIVFLPLGADVNTAVYRVAGEGGTPYFLKLRRGDFDVAIVAIPHQLHSHGNRYVIPPILTRAGQFYARVEPYAVILYPWVTGRDAYEVALSPGQWREFGMALRLLHAADLPLALGKSIPVETYTPYWRDRVRRYQASIELMTYAEPVAAEAAAFLRKQHAIITDLVSRAERLAAELSTHPLPSVLCHGDIHAWNLLLTQDGALYMVDWDTLVYAPKERDLMFVGAGIGGIWRDSEEAAWFYQGYGITEVSPVALAYYRYERIVQDIAEFAEQLLGSDAGGADRAQSLRYLVSGFEPGHTIDIAYRADRLTD